jgi:hypothetical protein
LAAASAIEPAAARYRRSCPPLLAFAHFAVMPCNFREVGSEPWTRVPVECSG